MASRNSPSELALSQSQHLDATGYKDQALEVLNDYFSKLRIRSWDPVHDRLAQLALKLSAELHQPTKALHSYIRLSVDYALDTLPTSLQSYINNCNAKIKEEQTRAEGEEKKCASPLLAHVDLPRLLSESIVKPVIDFLFDAIRQILNELVKQVSKYDDLYHSIVKQAFQFCVQYNRPEDVEKFSNDLSYYRSYNDLMGPSALKFIDSQYARYKAAFELKLFNQALQALSEANEFIKKDNVPLDLREKIEVAKHTLLQKGEYKLFTAIQHENLYTFYKESKLEPPIPLQQMANIILIETATSPLNASDYDLPTEISFTNFLNQSDIPRRSDLINRLIEKLLSSPHDKCTTLLIELISVAETGSDPFEICEKFIEFKKEFSNEQYFKEYEESLSSYAALRAIQSIRNHYLTIEFEELSSIISWLPIEKIQSIIISAARHSLIPAHINLKDKSVDFRPRGNQCLQNSLSPLNDQLCNIFDEFQKIKRNLPEDFTKKSSRLYNGEIYMTEEEFIKRKKTLEERTLKQKMEQKRIELEENKRREKHQKMLEDEERRKREEEKKKKEIRDKREAEFNFAYTEAKLIARDNEINFDSFLQETDENTPNHTGKSKSDDLEWIKYKNHQIKVKAIEEMRSESDIIAKKMSLVKEKIGKERILERLAQKHMLEQRYEGEAPLIQKLLVFQNKQRAKNNADELAEYEKMCNVCKELQPIYEAFVIQTRKEMQEASGLGSKLQPAMPLMGVLQQPPVEKQPVEEKKEDEVKEEEKKEEEKKEDVKEEEKKEEEKKPAPYQPPTSKPAPYQPPTSKPAPYQPPTSKPAPYQPPTSKPAPYQPSTDRKPSGDRRPYGPPRRNDDNDNNRPYRNNRGGRGGDNRQQNEGRSPNERFGGLNRGQGDRQQGGRGSNQGNRGGRGYNFGQNRQQQSAASRFGSISK
ncbi:eukaryotic translation initiation factor 3 subunit A [Histomonas meleagridis]|uniref:eukaryotic translation initiation factor 3 subunit A n=1 Tax=Histomonas meleagridis TaxID=135588 RepID=UPI0035594265|nr:eukaryotic translation initiation factor 3 subunit A [Histomonas meleagridis]KAH0796174.1 eukaryotic translation initiation factor 3 subunit A [Histomonas meleagridis]